MALQPDSLRPGDIVYLRVMVLDATRGIAYSPDAQPAFEVVEVVAPGLTRDSYAVRSLATGEVRVVRADELSSNPPD